MQGGEIVIRQGDMLFRAKKLESTSQPLRAPQAGTMARVIRKTHPAVLITSFVTTVTLSGS